jgi:hypothetical protein
MNPIKLAAFRDQGGKIRVNDQFVVTSIDMSELCYMIKWNQNCIPGYFSIQGREKTIEVHNIMANTDISDDGEVRSWNYMSRDEVETRDGPRRVSITVFND